MMEQSRPRWLNMALAGVLLMIVMASISSPLTKFINGFHLPLLFILIGYAYQAEPDFPGQQRRLARHWLMPYLWLCLLNLLLELLHLALNALPQHNFSLGLLADQMPTYLQGIVCGFGTVKSMPNCSSLWIVEQIFMALLLFYPINKCPRVLRGILAVLCLAISLYLAQKPKWPLNVDSAFTAVFFLWVGTLLRKVGLEKLALRNRWLALAEAMVLLAGGLVLAWLNPVQSVSFYGMKYGQPAIALASALLASLGTMLMCRWLDQIKRLDKGCNLLARLTPHALFLLAFDYRSASFAMQFNHDLFLPTVWPLLFLEKLLALGVFWLIWRGLTKLVKRPVWLHRAMCKL